MRPNSNYSDEEQNRAGANAWDTAEQARQKVEAYRSASAHTFVPAASPQFGTSHPSSGASGEGVAYLLAFIFFMPAFVPFIYAAVYTYGFVSNAADAPWIFGFAAAVVVFWLTMMFAMATVASLPRMLHSPVMALYMAGTHWVGARFFTINPWWIYSYTAFAGFVGWNITMIFPVVPKQTIGSVIRRLLTISAFVAVVAAVAWLPILRNAAQAWWRFTTTSPQPWDDYWATTMPKLVPGYSESKETICSRQTERMYPSAKYGQGVQGDYYKACLRAHGKTP